MSEPRAPGDRLDFQALHYASNDLPPAEAAAFEARLAQDQQARDALVAAAELLQPFGAPPLDLRYRDAVRRRLQAPRCAPTTGRPLFWMLSGAAAASLVFFLSGGRSGPEAPAPAVVNLSMPADAAHPRLARAANPTLEAAFFADLSSVQRLSKVHDDEAVRRRKSDERKLRSPILEVLRPTPPMPRPPTM